MTTGEYLWGKNKALQSEITSEMLANTGYHGREKYTSLEVVIFLKAFLQPKCTRIAKDNFLCKYQTVLHQTGQKY